jgi:hypothetical protein
MKFMIGNKVSMSYRNHRFYRMDEPPEPSTHALASPFIQKIGRHAVKKSGEVGDSAGTDGTKEKRGRRLPGAAFQGEERGIIWLRPAAPA